MGRNAAMVAIEKRQKREQYLAEFGAEKAAATRLNTFIDAEKRTGGRMNANEAYRILDQIQAQHNESLVARRKRLAELLLREREECESMLSHLTETDDLRRERLLAKARALREKREEEKKADTKKCTDRLFRETIDELRQAESRLRVMQVADGRYQQIEAEQQKKAEEAEDEEYFNQQAAEAQRKACLRARQDEEVKYRLQEQRKADLAAQVEGNEMRRELERQQKERDNEEFYRQVHEERVKETQKTLARRNRTREIAAEMKALNEELEQVRKEEYTRLRQEDKEELDRILAQIAEEKAAAAEEKVAKREKERAYMEEMKQTVEQRKANEHALDGLWKEANDAEWEKRERVWNNDREKRERLLRSILAVRRQQVFDNRARRQAERERNQKEDEDYLNSLPPDDAEERRRIKLREMKEMQMVLDMQISEQLVKKAEAEEEKKAELREALAREAIYKDRIAVEMRKLEEAKPDRYREVPLVVHRGGFH